MKFNGINHLAMATGDMDSTIRFWRDLLGMCLVIGLGEPEFRHYFFEINHAFKSKRTLTSEANFSSLTVRPNPGTAGIVA